MTLIIFAALLSGALFLFSISFLVEKRKLWKDEILQGVTGVKDWRLRLNDKTERFCRRWPAILSCSVPLPKVMI